MAAPNDLHILAGTGSRSLQEAPLADKYRAAELTAAELEERRSRFGDRLVVMSGMAEGFDKLLALTALRLDIKLWCAVPNHGYGAYYWGRKSLTGEDRLAEFERILAAAWQVTYVMEDIHHTSGLKLNGKHSNFVRNDFMVERAHEFLVWNPTSSGTKQCLATIVRSGRPYKVLDATTAGTLFAEED